MLRFASRAVMGLTAVVLIAGCQGVPGDFKPDPKLKTASAGQLQIAVRDVCIKAQRAKSSASTAELTKSCGCYAGKALKAMDKGEVDFYRTNGYFADSARPKAQTALNSCGLK
mgnify:CR=1 FL=1